MRESIGLLTLMRTVYIVAAAHVVDLEHVGVYVEVDMVLLRRQGENWRLLGGLFHPYVLDYCALFELSWID